MNKTTFGSLVSDTGLHLFELHFDRSFPEPKVNTIDIPGANGALDLTESVGGFVPYADRELKWRFAVDPVYQSTYDATVQAVAEGILGKRLNVYKSEDAGYHYDARITSVKEEKDGAIRYVDVVATAKPFMLKDSETSKATTLSTSYKTVTCAAGITVVPTFTCTAACTIQFAGTDHAVAAAGTYTFPDIVFSAGTNTVKMKGSGTCTIKYQDGKL